MTRKLAQENTNNMNITTCTCTCTLSMYLHICTCLQETVPKLTKLHPHKSLIGCQRT